MTDLCARVEAVVDEMAAGLEVTTELSGHVPTCARCQARLAMARRIERALADWPVAAPPAHFAADVARLARQDVWGQELVVDWGFNLALAASLVCIVAGAAGFVWLLGAMADPVEASRLAARPLTALAGQVRGQGLVVGTATALLATTAAAWWWGEERRRW
jgi:hypothetical protein